MKKHFLLIGVGLFLIILTVYDFTLKVDNKAHYYVNGIICGIGLCMVVSQFLKLRKQKRDNKPLKSYQAKS
ncbi:MAG TPA: hypothetical protein PK191_00890 [Niabella sp.]|nr:hypothetical protein [Niabella sp.]HOZ97642.1 hypothetical protein [Niabella sp.]HQW13948.1 hypothetical protein [Niabella sp.]HQX19509.1 hypothetical protein [Niabella sp.]HRB05726.1 hypothetical protein [Niabella sp.]